MVWFSVIFGGIILLVSVVIAVRQESWFKSWGIFFGGLGVAILLAGIPALWMHENNLDNKKAVAVFEQVLPNGYLLTYDTNRTWVGSYTYLDENGKYQVVKIVRLGPNEYRIVR